jgi:hypothetical protein
MHDSLAPLDWEQLESTVQLPAGWKADTARPIPLKTCMNDLRHFTRYQYRTKALLAITTTLPRLVRADERMVVYTKDVSREGIGLYAAEQLFPCERMKIWLPGQELQRIRVVRCRKLGECCFEVGTRFE